MMFDAGDVARYIETGEDVKILDVLEGRDNVVYLAQCEKTGTMYYLDDDDLERTENGEFEHEITVSDSVAMVTLYQTVGGRRTILARGHGHIIHDGAVGYAQAIGFAFSRIAKTLGGYSDERRGEERRGEESGEAA